MSWCYVPPNYWSSGAISTPEVGQVWQAQINLEDKNRYYTVLPEGSKVLVTKITDSIGGHSGSKVIDFVTMDWKRHCAYQNHFTWGFILLTSS